MLNKIEEDSSCEFGCNSWKILLKSMTRNEAIASLLESNGINDALWVIFTCQPDELEKQKNIVADLTEFAVKSTESVLHIFEKMLPDDKRPFAAIENAKENIRRTRLGEERLPRVSAAVASLDAYAAAHSAVSVGADAVAAVYAANEVFTHDAFDAYRPGGDAAGVAFAAGAAAFAAGGVSNNLFLTAVAAADAAKAAVGVASRLQKEDYDETKQNQMIKEIVLNYFQ